MSERKCCHCGEITDNFGPGPRKDGTHSWCRPCRAAYRRRYWREGGERERTQERMADKIQRTVNFPGAQYERLRAMARRRRTSIAHEIRMAVRDRLAYLEEAAE